MATVHAGVRDADEQVQVDASGNLTAGDKTSTCPTCYSMNRQLGARVMEH